MSNRAPLLAYSSEGHAKERCQQYFGVVKTNKPQKILNKHERHCWHTRAKALRKGVANNIPIEIQKFTTKQKKYFIFENDFGKLANFFHRHSFGLENAFETKRKQRNNY